MIATPQNGTPPHVVMAYNPETRGWAVQINGHIPCGDLVNQLEVLKAKLILRQLEAERDAASRRKVTLPDGTVPAP